jgi:acyl-CoA thioesterase-1
MAIADNLTYLSPVIDDLQKRFPDNSTINIVCHGHSVPAGYFATPFVNPFDSYPHLLHREIKERFPFSIVNVIVTAVGGESSHHGSERFKSDVLCMRPRVVTLDYGLNDRMNALPSTESFWKRMIEEALADDVKIILMTPSWDQSYFRADQNWISLVDQVLQIRRLADEYSVGLADSFLEFQRYIDAGGCLVNLLSHFNHPNRRAHERIAAELSRWFLAR